MNDIVGYTITLFLKMVPYIIRYGPIKMCHDPLHHHPCSCYIASPGRQAGGERLVSDFSLLFCLSDADRCVRMLVFAAVARVPVPLQLRRPDGLLVPTRIPSSSAGPAVLGHAGLRLWAVRIPTGVGTEYCSV